MQHNLASPETVALLTNPEKVALIRDFNLGQGLPEENIDKVLFNGAIFEGPPLINFEIFVFPAYEFTHPLSAYTLDEQAVHITRYGATLSRVNHPCASFIGINYKTPSNLSIPPSVTIHTNEINLQGYWTLIQRTVFLHQPEPTISLDIIAPSDVVAPLDPDHSIRAPDDIFYTQPADLWTPR